MSSHRRLAAGSDLTDVQVISLELYLRFRSGELTLKEAAALRDGGVSIGSFYRTVQQARHRVRSACITLLVALWVGVVRAEDLRRLLEIAGRGAPNFSEAEEDQLLAVLGALVDKIVM